MREIDQLLSEYGESHRNMTNKLIHWICVPVILFSIMGMLSCIPWFGEKSFWLNWGAIAYFVIIFYYMRLSIPLMIGFVFIGFAIVLGINVIYINFPSTSMQFYIHLGIFVVAWIFQFIGHEIEGKKPSFFKDLQFLLVGPGWLLGFIYKKMGIKY